MKRMRQPYAAGKFFQLGHLRRFMASAQLGKRCGRDRGTRISGMDALAPIPPSGSRDADGLRASELEQAVQGMDGHGDLGGLMTVRARAERAAHHPLVAGDRYLGQSATMVS